MVQGIDHSIMSLPFKHEDLSSIFVTHVKQKTIRLCACNFSAGAVEIGGFLKLPGWSDWPT